MKLRAATIDDAQLLFVWRNDPETRKQSRNSDPIDYDAHVKWLATQIANGHAPLIAEHDGPAGTVRIASDGEMSWTVAPDRRGKGFGTRMVKEAMKFLGPKWAEIKEDNIASVKIAQAVGLKFKIIQKAKAA